jgi:arylsulfatase A-like enzyme
MRRWLLAGTALLLAGAIFWYFRDRPQPANLLIITADTTRLDDLGVYGGPARTPRLQDLRDDGLLLHQAYSVAFGTTPSHASLFASTYAHQHGVYCNKDILGDEFVTLSEVLSSHGAVTAAFVSSRAVRRELGLDQGFQSYDQQFRGPERRGDATVDRFVTWLADVDEWFFAWIHLNEPHWPYRPPHRFGMHYLPDEKDFHKVGSYRRFNRKLKAKQLLDQGRERFDEHERLARGLYRGEIDFMDQQIGRAIDALKKRDLYDRTAIVFIADHGENFGDPDPSLAFTHSLLHQHVVRLPLIFKLPYSRHAGEEHSFLVTNIDIAPTLIDLVGLQAVSSWAGESILSVLSGRRSSLRDHVVLESAYKREISVRTPRWVYRRPLVPASGPTPLPAPQLFYDLASDPAESENIYGSLPPEARAAFEELDEISRQFLGDGDEIVPETLETPEHIESLRALGYVQ